MTENLIKVLNSLNSDQWNDFIFKMSYNIPTNPVSDFLGEYFSNKLMKLYRAIIRHAPHLLEKYFQSCLINLRTIPKIDKNSEIIYNYLYIIHELKPIHFRHDLLSILKDRELSDLEYGSDNLEDMLMKSIVNLEDRGNNELNMFLNSMPSIFGYKLYLKTISNAYLGNEELTLQSISDILTKEIDFVEDFVEDHANAIIDVVPRYVSYKSLIRYLLKFDIKPMNNRATNLTIKEILNFWGELEKTMVDSLYLKFLSDILKSNEQNALMDPTYLEILAKVDSKMPVYIEKFYSSESGLNYKDCETKDECAYFIVQEYNKQMTV